MRFDLYAFAGPRDLDADAVAARIDGWEAQGADPTTAPFDPSSDVAGFYRELEHDLRGMEEFTVVADAEPHTGRGPVWLQTDPAPPAHIAAIRLPRTTKEELRDAVADVYGTATKFDLLVFDPHQGVIHRPLAEMAAYASATFWPWGAARGAIVGGLGLVGATAAYVIGIPIISGIVIVIGLFLFVLSVVTFVAEARKRGSAAPAP